VISTAKTDEEWRDVVGFGEGLYQVSSSGKVRSLDRVTRGRNGSTRIVRGRDLVQAHNGAYPTVNISVGGRKLTKLVHGLVAAAFLGSRPRYHEVRHKDGDGFNCRADNLEYGSSSDNTQDTFRHGTMLTGEKHQNTILTEDQVEEIRALSKGSIRQWAEDHGVSKGHVYNIRYGARR
jgi:hypothetical protein